MYTCGDYMYVILPKIGNALNDLRLTCFGVKSTLYTYTDPIFNMEYLDWIWWWYG